MTKVPQTRGRKTKQNPSKTAIAKVLREAVFDPREPGPLKIIADVGQADYYVRRAQEFLVPPVAGSPVVPSLNIKNAIALLALAVVTNDNG